MELVDDVLARLRALASNLELGLTMKIYHRIRNVRNGERNEERGKKKAPARRTGRAAGRGTRDSCASSKVTAARRALILNPG